MATAAATAAASNDVTLAPENKLDALEAPAPQKFDKKFDKDRDVVTALLQEARAQAARKQQLGRRPLRRPREETARRESAYERAPREAFGGRVAGKIGRRVETSPQ